MEKDAKELPLAVAAYELGITWPQAWNRLLKGKLTGRRDDRGRWLVRVDSIEQMRAESSK